MSTGNVYSYINSAGYLRLDSSPGVTKLVCAHRDLVQYATGLYSGIFLCVGAAVALTGASGLGNSFIGVSCCFLVTFVHGGCGIVNCCFVVFSFVNTLGRGCVFRVLVGHEANISPRLEMVWSCAWKYKAGFSLSEHKRK